MASADFSDLILGQLYSSTTTFNKRILNIPLVASNKQVRWVHAGWVIAMVADQHTIRDWSVCNEVGYPGCCIQPTLDSQQPIPVIVSGASPYPAITIRLINLSPEKGKNFGRENDRMLSSHDSRILSYGGGG